MGQTHDFTKILWGDEFVIDTSLKDAQGVITGQGPLAAGDEIILCVKCRVDEVEEYTNVSDMWQARISFEVPVSSEVLTEGSPIRAVKGLVDQLSEAIQHLDVYQRIEQIFSADRLTQVTNRGRFETRLKEEWQRMRRDQAPLSLILCTLEGMADFQTQQGEQTTNQSIAEIAQTIQKCATRPSDVVARYEPYVFAVLLPSTPFEGAGHISDEIRARVNELEIFSPTQEPVLTLRLAIATLVPSQTNGDPQTLVNAALRSQ
jgi:diguanylate cyclase (GGDEF)-like protein